MSTSVVWGEIRSLLSSLKEEWATRDTYTDETTLRDMVFWQALLVCLRTYLHDDALSWSEYTRQFVPYIRECLHRMGGTLWVYPAWVVAPEEPASQLFDGVTLRGSASLTTLQSSEHLIRRLAIPEPDLITLQKDTLKRFSALRSLDILRTSYAYDKAFTDAVSELSLERMSFTSSFPLSRLKDLHIPCLTLRGVSTDGVRDSDRDSVLSPKVSRFSVLGGDLATKVPIHVFASAHLKQLILADFSPLPTSLRFDEVFPALEVLCHQTNSPYLRELTSENTKSLLEWFRQDPPKTLRLVLSTEQDFLSRINEAYPHIKTVLEGPTYNLNWGRLSTWTESLDTRILKHS